MTAVAVPDAGLGLSVSLGDRAVVAVAGELDLASAPYLAAVLDALIDQGHLRVGIDCSQLSFIDASGVGVVAAAQARLLHTDGGIRLYGVSGLAYRVFEIIDLLDVLHVERPNADARPKLGDARETDPITWEATRLAARSARADALADTLSRMMALIPEIIVACDGASVTLRRPDYLMTAAASDDTVRDLDNIQYARDQGPCVEAANTGVQTHADALAQEQRWESFTPQARGRGIESILSSPIIVDDQPAGALNLYSRSPQAFLPTHQDLATVLAAQAAMLLGEPDPTTGRDLDDRIHDALSSRDVIAQAQGILMERLDVDARTAYATLRRDAVRTSTPLRARAGSIIAETQQRSASPHSEVPAHE